MSRRLGIALAVLLVAVGRSHATDYPVGGKRIVLARTAATETFTLVLNDPAVPIPPIGGPDDPSGVGMRIELFRAGGEYAELDIAAGPGKPGWSVHDGAVTRYVYRNAAAPDGPSRVRSVVLKQGKAFRIVARRTGLALAGPQGSVGVRIDIGGTRVCALFAGAAVQQDRAGKFVAANAERPGLSACTDEGLFGVACGDGSQCGGLCPAGSDCGGAPGFGCACISRTQPCGDTAPVCSGQCPAGEECANIGGVPFPTCGCLPTGSTGCGTTYPTCGGDCPTGLSCFVDTFICCGGITVSGCGCLSGPPPPPCGGPCPPGTQCVFGAPGFPTDCYPIACGAGGSCPPGSTCGAILPSYCGPIPCTGGAAYPTCDGTCDPGLACTGFVQGGGACYCAP